MLYSLRRLKSNENHIKIFEKMLPKDIWVQIIKDIMNIASRRTLAPKEFMNPFNGIDM